MDRAFESGAIAEAPTPPDPPLLGYPSESGTPTEPGAWWFYMITEECRAVIASAGIEPSATTVNQMASAISTLISNAIEAALPYTINAGAVANTIALRDGSADLTASGFNVSSDATLKEDVRTIKAGALERLDAYRGVTYRRTGSSRIRAGIIAQEFARARPEGVRAVRQGKKDDATELLEVDVMATVAELIEALREERNARRALEQRLQALEGL